jgi:hypothetical protein
MVDVKFDPFLMVTLTGRYPAQVNSIKGNAIHGVFRDGWTHKNFSLDISTEDVKVFEEFVVIHAYNIDSRVVAPTAVRGFVTKLLSGKLNQKDVFQGLRAGGIDGFDVRKSYVGGWYFFDSVGEPITLGDFIVNNIDKFND